MTRILLFALDEAQRDVVRWSAAAARRRSWKASVARYKGVYAGVMEQPSAR